MANVSRSAFLIPEIEVKRLVAEWLKEDIPSFDVGGAVVGDKMSVAALYVKEKVSLSLSESPLFSA